VRKKSNSFVFVILLLFLTVGAFYYSWKYIVPSYGENRAKSASLDTDIANATKKLDSLKKAQTSLTQLGDIPTQLSVAVPEDKDMPNLITELEAVAAKYGMILPTISVSNGSTATTSGTAVAPVASSSDTSGNSGNTITVAIASPGSFENITGLIAALEKDIRFMNIKSVTISSSEGKAGTTGLTVALQIEAYKRGDAAATTTASSTGANATTTTP